jgi:hypothetical protein
VNLHARESEHAAEPEPPAGQTVRTAVPLSLASAADVVALQRQIGNRSVGRVLEGLRTLARNAITVSNPLSEARSGGLAPISWTSSYDVDFTSTECLVTVRVQLVRDGDVTEEQQRIVEAEAQNALRRVWDRRFELEDLDTHNRFTVSVHVQFVPEHQHVTVALHSGARAQDLTNWSVQKPPTSRAHELGHQLGMYDEYVDAQVINRATATSPGVYVDHSVMGNYYSEGADEAVAQLRHGVRLADAIGRATRRRFRVSFTPGPGDYVVPAGDTRAA